MHMLNVYTRPSRECKFKIRPNQGLFFCHSGLWLTVWEACRMLGERKDPATKGLRSCNPGQGRRKSPVIAPAS